MSAKKKTLVALLIAVFIPLAFFFYFEIKKHQTGIRIKKLPVLSLSAIPDFSFTAHTGELVTRESIRGKITVADFFYTTCPGICKAMSREMARLQDYIGNHPNLKSEYLLLSHTVDPEVDSIQTLKDYAAAYSVDSSLWLLLTGNKQEIYDLAINFYKLPVVEMYRDTAPEPFVHSERFILLDKEGFIRGYYDGTDSVSVKQLMKDIVMLDIDYEISKKKK